MGTTKSNGITMCSDVFNVLYKEWSKKPWTILHEHGGKLGAIQGFYNDMKATKWKT